MYPPVSIIGVAIGMLLTGFDFGFFPIAGWLGLLGMVIKNVIVLLDEINVQRRDGVVPYTAVIESTVSRTRPVLNGRDDYYSRYGSVVVRYSIRRNGSYYYFRADVCHIANPYS